MASGKKKVTFRWGNLLSLNPEYPHQELTKDSYLIGRHQDCDIKFQNDSISNRHCRVFMEEHEDGKSDPQAYLEDLSSNGTFVNGKKIGKNKRHLLSHNDEIQLLLKKDASNPLADKYFMFQYPKAEKSHDEASGSGSGSERSIHDHYQIKQVLGSGNFAEVKLALDKETGEKYAVKVIDKTKFSESPKFFEALRREVEIMMKIQHPNLVSIVDYYDEEKTLYLVLEYLSGGDLFDRIVDKQKLTEAEAKLVFYQLLQGVKYLHDQNIAHRDLKPENILLLDKSDDLPVKITDFGLARIVGETSFMKTVCGTPFYLAPDVTNKENPSGYNKGVDLWSLGVILYISLCGYPPFSDERKDHSLDTQVKKGLYAFHSPYWDNISEDAKDMVRGLLNIDSSKRLTVEQALEHPWITNDTPKLKEVHQKMISRTIHTPKDNENENQNDETEDSGNSTFQRNDTIFPVSLIKPESANKRKLQEVSEQSPKKQQEEEEKKKTEPEKGDQKKMEIEERNDEKEQGNEKEKEKESIEESSQNEETNQRKTKKQKKSVPSDFSPRKSPRLRNSK